MRLKEAGKGVVVISNTPITYKIGFNGNDETELEANTLEELNDLWASLVSELGTTLDSVDYVEMN